MTWQKRSPLSFPAHFARTLQEAKRFEDTPVLFGTYRSAKAANIVANDFRYYRWCLREQPLIQPGLTAMENTYDIRMSREVYPEGEVVLFLTLKATRLSTILERNPHLTDCFAE